MRRRLLGRLLACAGGAAVVAALMALPTLASSNQASSTAKSPSKAVSCKIVKQPVKSGGKQKRSAAKLRRVCKPVKSGSKANLGEIPAWVPNEVAFQVGEQATTRGDFGWAKLGSTLANRSTFQGPSGNVAVRLVNAPSAKRYDFENGAVYVGPQFTSVQAFHGKSLKESIVVPRRLGVRMWSWKFDLPAGVTAKLLPSGAVDLGVGLYVPAPRITDADGNMLAGPAAWSVQPNGTISMQLDDATYPTPYVIDPGVAPTVAFTGFSGASGNTYIDPAFALTRIFINSSQSGNFTVNAVVNDPDTPVQSSVCFPVYGAGWTSDGGCLLNDPGTARAGILATYFSGSTSGNPATDPGGAFTSTTSSTWTGAACSVAPGLVGPFSRIEPQIDSWQYWGTPGANDDTPYNELCEERFSAKWVGAIRTPTYAAGGVWEAIQAGQPNPFNNFFFGTVSDDGIRVKVNGNVVLAEWGEHGPSWHTSCPVPLASNMVYPIEVEYFENNANNRVNLRWRTPGQTGVTIPPSSANAAYCYSPSARQRWTRTNTTGSTPWVPASTNLTNGTAPNWNLVPTATTPASSTGLLIPGNTFSRTYTWTPGAATPTPATQNITATDPQANSGSTPFTVIADGAGPVGGTMAVSTPAGGGLTNAAASTIRLNWNSNGTTDGAAGTASGINGTGEIRRQEAPFDNANDTCDAFPSGVWTSGNSVAVRTGITIPTSNASDTSTGSGTMSSGMCYRWALVFYDNVGNAGAVVSQTVRIDSTAPTSTVVLTENTNPQWMHVSGSTIFYNNSGTNTGELTVDVDPADTASGMGAGANVTMATLPAGWVTVPPAPSSPTWQQRYSWSSASAAVPASRQASVTDAAGNLSASPGYNIVQDISPPAGNVSYTGGLWGSTSFTVGFTNFGDGTGSGLATWQIERQSTPLNTGTGICDPFPGTWGPVGPVNPTGATFVDTLVPNNCYRWRFVMTDNVGNTATIANINTVRFENLPPVASFRDITSTSGSVYLQPASSIIWFRSSGSGGFNIRVNANDTFGMDRVTFPSLGAGWTGPVPASDLAGTTIGPDLVWESAPYTWSGGAWAPGAQNAVASDTAGNTTNVAFEVRDDLAVPAGGRAEPPNAIQASSSVALNLTAAVEIQSGTKSWAIQYQQATLSNGTCGAFGVWTASALSGSGIPPATQVFAAPGNGCYRFRLNTTDNVDNTETGATSTNTVQVDTSAPTVAFSSPADLSTQSGTFTMSGTSSEGQTSLASVSLTFAGPVSGTACANATLTPAGAGSWTWSCAWASPASDGTYTVTATATDAAGNIAVTIRQFIIDNTGPTAAWYDWYEPVNSPYLAWGGASQRDQLWYNPAAPVGAWNIQARLTATDLGSGMNRVDFPGLGAAGWAPAVGGSDNTVGMTPAFPANDMWTFNYVFNGGAAGNPAPLNATAFDNAGASTGAPALGFRVDPDSTPPSGATFTDTGGLQTATTYTATAMLGNDTESGVERWRLDYRFAELVDGVCQPWEPWNDGNLVTGFFGNGSNGANVNFTIRLNDPDANGIPNWVDSFCFQTQLFVTDGVGNVHTGPSSAVHEFDFGTPLVAFTGPANGSSQSGTFNVTGTATDAIVEPFGYPLTGSGLQDVTVTYLLPDGPDADLLPDASGTVCTTSSFVGPWTSEAWSCPWNTSALPDGTYTLSARSRDVAGRQSTIQTWTLLLDNQAPIVSFHSWAEAPSNTNLHTAGNVAWIRPTAPVGAYQLNIFAVATDAGSGVANVTFPPLGVGWLPAGATVDTTPSAIPTANSYSASYSFTTPSTTANPGVINGTATDNAGNVRTFTYEVRHDNLPPSGIATNVTAGVQNSPNVLVGLDSGADGALESGIGNWFLQVDVAPLADDTCGAFPGAWNSIQSGLGAAPATYTHDVSGSGSQCYRYRLRVGDNVNNIGTSAASNARRVDLIAPTVAIATPPDGSAQSGTFNVTGTAVDAHSGIDHVRLEWFGPGATSGVICDPATLGGASPNWTFTCSWATGALADGTYTIRATSYDRAGNVSVVDDSVVLLDNQPPYLSFYSFSNIDPNYAYWAGPVGTNRTIWFNPSAPNGTYSFDVNVISYDLGSSVDRVEFDGAGTGWTPTVAPSIDTTSSAAPVADSYTATYSFDTANPGLVDPSTVDITAYDPASNPSTTNFEIEADNTAPSAGSLTYPSGFVASTSVTVTFATGDDGTGSGVRGWQLYRRAGTLSGASCVGYGAWASITSGTGTFSGTHADTVSNPGCFQYELRTTDNVGNVGYVTGTDDLKVDLSPPTGTITLAEGTNPAYQYLANPTRLFVNTNQSGTFTADTNVTAASGILDVNLPNLATGFSGHGVFSGPGPAIGTTYSWSSGAGAPVIPATAVARSNSLGVLNLPFEVIADPDAPTGQSLTYTSGYTTAGTLNLSYTAGNDAGGSGVASYQLQREDATLAGGVCTWSGSWTNVGPISGPTTVVEPLTQATCVRYRVQTTDNVGNVGNSAAGAAVMVDQTAPTGATITLAEGTNPGNQYLVTGTSIWINPTLSGSFTATVLATDPESGTGSATFPTFGAGWTTTPAVDATAPYGSTFSWAAGAATPILPSVIVANGSGLTTTIPFTVQLDGAAPAGATLDQQNGLDSDFSVDLSFTNGTDIDSGVATWRIERRSATYTVATDTCGPVWSAWGTYPMPLGQPASPYVDVSVAQPMCYQYQLVEIDNVGNQRITDDGDTVKVVNDIFPPAAFDVNVPTNPVLPAITTGVGAPGCDAVPTFTTATPLVTWNASSDIGTGLDRYDVYFDGTGSVDGSVPAPGTSWTSTALSDGAHTLGVRALDFATNFTNSGPTFPVNVRVDSTAPTASVVSPATSTWTNDTTPTFTWSATDANCLARVEVYVDFALVAVASGSESSWTPSAALLDGLHTWRIEAIDSVGRRTASLTSAFGVDTTPPTAFALTTPSAGDTVRGFVNVNWTPSSDAHSGLAPATAYEVWIDGTLQTTVGSALTTANVGGITNGAHTIEVRAVDAVGNTTTTASVNFTGYPVIPSPVHIAPAPGTPAPGARINTVPTLDWDWPSDGGPAPTDFDVLVDGVQVGNVTYPTTQLAIADPGDGVHTWQIRQHDPYTGTVTTTAWSFLLDRTAPLNAGPLTRTATTVSWPVGSVSDPAAPTPSGIQNVEFWYDSGSGPVLAASLAGGVTSYNFGALPDGIYTMWTRAIDRAGNFTDSLIPLNFTNDSVPPTPFALIPPPALPALPAITDGPATGPACETALTYVGALPTFNWNASSDATSGLAGYDILVDGLTVASVGPGVTSWTPAAPLSGGAHTWSVIARDNFGMTRASTPAPMNVRIDTANPSATLASPTNNSYTGDTTPTLTWLASDDNCAARVELTVDGAVVDTYATSVSSWTAPAPLAEGAHTWSIRVFDSAGNVTSSSTNTVTIDTTAPTGITAINPPDGGSVPEDMMTFSWTAGSDVGSGVDHYDLWIDGVLVATNVNTTSRGTFAIYAGAHTWRIRAYDAVGNSALFTFTFTATAVPDVTPPNPFNLLTPADGASIAAGTPLTWEPAWDFLGTTQYRVFIDGLLSGTVAAPTTSFTPTVGSGTAICAINYDPATSAGCITGPTYTNGKVSGSSAVLPAPASSTWNSASYAGYNAGGNAHGFGNPTITPTTLAAAGFDGDRVWTAAEYSASIPAAGADIRFEHRYRTHMNGASAYDGGTVEVMVDQAGDGFGNDMWKSTCTYGTKGTYGTSLQCDYEIVEVAGGFNAVLAGPATNHPLAYRNVFAGNATSMQLTKIRMSQFAGKNVRFRFRMGMDSCHSGLSATMLKYCPTGVGRSLWRIDNVTLANPALTPGPHTWYVQAVDAAGNTRNSNQTWNFNLL